MLEQDKTFDEQLNNVMKTLSEYMQMPLIYGYDLADKPKDEDGNTKYPFISYTLMTMNKVQDIDRLENTPEALEESWYQQWELIISVECVSHDPFVSLNGVNEIQSWFKDNGHDVLYANNVVCVTEGTVTARNIFLVNDSEERYGADIRLRIGRIRTKLTTYIETVNLPPLNIVTD